MGAWGVGCSELRDTAAASVGKLSSNAVTTSVNIPVTDLNKACTKDEQHKDTHIHAE